MKYYAIIVAGGIGSRMKSDLPKQFIEINQKPIIVHTIEAFQRAFDDLQIIVVMNEQYLDYWAALWPMYLKKAVAVIAGGENRFQSVKKGLSLVRGTNNIIGIHDAVRPCIGEGLIRNIYKKAEIEKAVIPLIPLKDSIRKISDATGGTSVAKMRSSYRLVQTPQCFTQDILTHAYNQEYSIDFTDDASVVEAQGYQIKHIDGDVGNIKITTPEDLQWAKLFLIDQ